MNTIWVCYDVQQGRYFWVESETRPNEQLGAVLMMGQLRAIAVPVFRVVYGPCSEEEANTYMEDMR